jgi:hypothetical protein
MLTFVLRYSYRTSAPLCLSSRLDAAGFSLLLSGSETLPSGYQLRAARSLIGWSQTDLAKASHVDHTTIGRLRWPMLG